jgi:hypothetical protein
LSWRWVSKRLAEFSISAYCAALSTSCWSSLLDACNSLIPVGRRQLLLEFCLPLPLFLRRALHRQHALEGRRTCAAAQADQRRIAHICSATLSAKFRLSLNADKGLGEELDGPRGIIVGEQSASATRITRRPPRFLEQAFVVAATSLVSPAGGAGHRGRRS